ncbi:MAG TPA: hypothetical protein VI434_11420 [Candidatus Dormibacteraeota bacterium]
MSSSAVLQRAIVNADASSMHVDAAAAMRAESVATGQSIAGRELEWRRSWIPPG